MGKAREIRLAENESLFREVNEQLQAAVLVTPHAARDDVGFVCECSDPACTEILSLSLAEYETVRAQGARFAVRPGHHTPEIERVVRKRHGYWVVEKTGAAAEAAEQLDPRDDAA